MSTYEDDIDLYEKPTGKRRRKRRMSTAGKWAIALLVELIIITIMGYGVFRIYLHSKYQKFDHVVDLKEEELKVNKGANEDMKGYTNIALFGIDARDNSLGKGNRSDAIMVASINNDTKDIRIVSIYRDTLVDVTKDATYTSTGWTANTYTITFDANGGSVSPTSM